MRESAKNAYIDIWINFFAVVVTDVVVVAATAAAAAAAVIEQYCLVVWFVMLCIQRNRECLVIVYVVSVSFLCYIVYRCVCLSIAVACICVGHGK